MKLGDSRVLRKAVNLAAGRGTRLLSVTNVQPKEMLPVFSKAKNGDLFLTLLFSGSR